MVEIAGFRALRYAPTPAASLAEVVAPPYDVIDAAELRRLWQRSPYNVARLTLPAGDLPPEQREQGYGLAAERLRAWKARGILAADPQPSLYLYRQRFHLAGGEPRTRQGFFALARLSEWGEGIFRHELTLPGPVADRTRLLEACQANLSSIFGLYSDPRQEVAAALEARAEGQAPTAEVVDERGVWHGLWRISEPDALRQVAAQMRDRWVVVADGHHRYTAALAYRNRQRELDASPGRAAPWDYVLFYLAALEDPGLVILPTHQVLHGLAAFAPPQLMAEAARAFVVRELPSPAALAERLEALAAAPQVVLGVVVGGPRCYLLQAPRPSAPGAPEEALDVAVLRRRLVEPLLRAHGAEAHLEAHLRYTHEAQEAAAWVTTGQADVAFIVRPAPLEQVRAVALAHRVMPQKSTYFYPKVLSGLVFHDYAQWQGQPHPLPETATSPR